MPDAANTASKLAVNFVSRSRTKNRNLSARSPTAYMRLRACWVTQSPRRVPCNSKDVDPACSDLEDEEHVDPTQQHGVDGEEVTRQHRRRLGPAELPPGRTGASGSWVEARLVEDVPDCRRGHLIAKPDEFAVDAAVTVRAEKLIQPLEPLFQPLSATLG